jgi:hypothetical protein
VRPLLSTAALATLALFSDVTSCSESRALDVDAGVRAAVTEIREAGAAISGPDSCTPCHTEIGEEWGASMHHASFSDGTFQAALGLEQEKDRAFCIGCHAPEKAQEASSVSNGVGCGSCHATPHLGAPAAKQACSGCHEFRFDDARAELVQRTLEEHATSKAAQTSCQDCHMKKRGDHRDHRFVAGHEPSEIARSVHVEATSAQRNAIRFRISSSAGHAFPTGDMFRRVRLRVFGDDAHGQVVADAERVFERSWSTIRSGPQAGSRTETSDTRIHGTWQGDIVLDTTAAIAVVRWELLYERVVVVRNRHVGVASSDVIAEGTLHVSRALMDARR